MPCLPDVFDRIKAMLPLLELLAALATCIALVAVLVWAPKGNRCLRLASRIVGVAGSVLLVFTLLAAAFPLALVANSPPTKTRLYFSPDHRQVAALFYDAGFLGRDNTRV